MAAPSPEKPEPTMAILMWGGSGRSAGADQGWSAGSDFAEGGAQGQITQHRGRFRHGPQIKGNRPP